MHQQESDHTTSQAPSNRNRQWPIIVLLALLTSLISYWMLNRDIAELKHIPKETLTTVSTEPLQISNTLSLSLRGRVRSKETLLITASSHGKIYLSKDVIQGKKTFAKGSALYKQDDDLAKKQLYQARSALTKAKINHQQWQASHPRSNNKLKAQEKLLLEQIQSAELEVKIAKQQLEQLNYTAPYDALLTHLFISNQQEVRQGQNLLEITNVESTLLTSSISTQLRNLIQPYLNNKIALSFQSNAFQGLPSYDFDPTNSHIQISPWLNQQQQHELEITLSNNPIPLNAFLDYSLSIETEDQWLSIDNEYIHQGNKLWLMHQNTLHIIELDIDYDGPEYSQIKLSSIPEFIQGKTTSYDQFSLITSHINLPRQGQKVQESPSN